MIVTVTKLRAVDMSPCSVSPRAGDCTAGPRCTCRDCVASRQAKKKKQVEDIDPDTLKKIQALEWEKKHG